MPAAHSERSWYPESIGCARDPALGTGAAGLPGLLPAQIPLAIERPSPQRALSPAAAAGSGLPGTARHGCSAGHRAWINTARRLSVRGAENLCSLVSRCSTVRLAAGWLHGEITPFLHIYLSFFFLEGRCVWIFKYSWHRRDIQTLDHKSSFKNQVLNTSMKFLLFFFFLCTLMFPE